MCLYSAPFDITVADGITHHVCITWDLSIGKIKMYVEMKKRVK